MAARKKKVEHEEHQNHEAWAIPYGDLVTLLLAFFVVMYAVSSLNEGKYRVLSKSLEAAFNGSPKSIEPIQIGEQSASTSKPSAVELDSSPAPVMQPLVLAAPLALLESPITSHAASDTREAADAEARAGLERIAQEVEEALQNLIDENLVVVRRHQTWLEVEIRTDILFPSGVALLSPEAVPIIQRLAITLGGFPNSLRIEGHTDNVAINTPTFPSNWELSAARAASVARLFADTGIDPHKLAILGLGEFHPDADNATAEGRNRNRRVKIIVLGETEDLPTPTLVAGSQAAP